MPCQEEPRAGPGGIGSGRVKRRKEKEKAPAEKCFSKRTSALSQRDQAPQNSGSSKAAEHGEDSDSSTFSKCQRVSSSGDAEVSDNDVEGGGDDQAFNNGGDPDISS